MSIDLMLSWFTVSAWDVSLIGKFLAGRSDIFTVLLVDALRSVTGWIVENAGPCIDDVCSGFLCCLLFRSHDTVHVIDLGARGYVEEIYIE